MERASERKGGESERVREMEEDSERAIEREGRRMDQKKREMDKEIERGKQRELGNIYMRNGC